jgi:hypothetical protein
LVHMVFPTKTVSSVIFDFQHAKVQFIASTNVSNMVIAFAEINCSLAAIKMLLLV